VDRGHVEPGDGVLNGLARVRSLLRQNLRRALAWHHGHPYEQLAFCTSCGSPTASAQGPNADALPAWLAYDAEFDRLLAGRRNDP
jgi:hypothetical protein